MREDDETGNRSGGVVVRWCGGCATVVGWCNGNILM